MADQQDRIVIDHVIVVCKGCRSERTFYPDANLVGAEALIDWMQRIPGCSCGASHCDIRAHMKGNSDA